MRSGAIFISLLGLTVLAACGTRLVAPAGPGQPLPPVASPAVPLAIQVPPATVLETPGPVPAATNSAPLVSQPAELPRVSADAVLNLPGQSTAVYHEVFRGENLSTIARKYGLTADQLQKANGLDAGAVLQPGQLLFIPTR